MRNRIAACLGIACLSVLTGCSVSNNATESSIASDNTVISKEVSDDGILTITEYDEKITCECDLDGDGKNEIITADYSQTLKDHQLPINMTIMKSNEEVILWQDISLGLPSAGWKSYYITVVDGSPYLIEYHPPEERQGLCYYSCKVFTIDSKGNEIILKDISGDAKEAVDEFDAEASEYMDNAYPFISTLNGNIMTSRFIFRDME